MDLQTYLHEIEHAAGETLKLVWFERRQMEDLQVRIAALSAEVADANRRLESMALNPDLDDDNLSTSIYWDTYFGPEKDRFYAEKSKPDLELLIATREFSRNAQSGSLLQYAKQGISLVHHALAACPDGRFIGSQPLKDIVWQGRNQALHWDEGNFRRPVETCFRTLAQEMDPKFGDFTSRNLASDVVELLGWRTFDDFKADMLSF
jgi:hypothetical protein